MKEVKCPLCDAPLTIEDNPPATSVMVSCGNNECDVFRVAIFTRDIGNAPTDILVRHISSVCKKLRTAERALLKILDSQLDEDPR